MYTRHVVALWRHGVQAGAQPAEHADASSPNTNTRGFDVATRRYRGANSYHNSNRLTFLRVPAWRALLVHPGGVAPYLRLGEWPHERDSSQVCLHKLRKHSSGSIPSLKDSRWPTPEAWCRVNE